jgi:DNA-binding IclR family transcriptional regulator
LRIMSASASASAAVTSASTGSSHRTSRSLVRGLTLLRLFTPERPERGISELAVQLGVSPATASRFASTCLEVGWLERGSKRQFRLTRRSAGPGLAVLATLEVTGAGERALRQLRAQTGRTVGLVVLDATDVLYLHRYRGYHRGEYQLARGLGAGSRRPARDTAAGRALLAGAPELTVDEGELPGRARGLAIAVPAHQGERTSAIELTVPAESMSAAEMVAELGEPLRAAAAALRAALGEEATEESVAAQTT